MDVKKTRQPKPIKSAKLLEMEKRDAAIYADYVRLMSIPGSMSIPVQELIGKKYLKPNGKPLSRQAIWAIIMKQQAVQEARNAELEDKLT